jgi:plasmid stabilization system protein ParE
MITAAAAKADLETIADRIAADNPSRAVTFIIELPSSSFGADVKR